jgi:hypothetical protein
VVADYEEHSAVADRGGQRTEQPGTLLWRQLNELRRHQVERPRLGRPSEQINTLKLDASGRCRIGLTSMLSSPLQRDAGDVGRDHGPSSAGKPDGIGALATAHIQRSAGRPLGDFGHQLRVGVAAPDPLRGPVPLIPETLVEYQASAVSVLTHPPSIACRWTHRPCPFAVDTPVARFGRHSRA